MELFNVNKSQQKLRQYELLKIISQCVENFKTKPGAVHQILPGKTALLENSVKSKENHGILATTKASLKTQRKSEGISGPYFGKHLYTIYEENYGQALDDTTTVGLQSMPPSTLTSLLPTKLVSHKTLFALEACQTLDGLACPVDKWHYILACIMSRMLDATTFIEWQNNLEALENTAPWKAFKDVMMPRVSYHQACKIAASNKDLTAKALPSSSSNTSTSTTTEFESISPSPTTFTSCHMSPEFPKKAMILATALVKIKSCTGKFVIARAFLDQGSELNLISEYFVRCYNLQRHPSNISIMGVGASSSTSLQSKSAVILDLQSCINDFHCNISAYVLPRLTCQLPSMTIKRNWSHLRGIRYADPDFHQPGRVDIILGVEMYDLILKSGLRKAGKNAPIAQKTSLGWIISGSAPPEVSFRDTINICCH